MGYSDHDKEAHEFDDEDSKKYGEMLKLYYDATRQKTIELIDLIQIQSDWNILDVGAGIGVLAPEFLERLSGGDGSLTLLEPVKNFGPQLNQIVAANPGKVFLKQNAIEDVNYQCDRNPDGYDVIFIRLVLHHCDATDAFKQLMSFLKPGGLFVVQELVHGTCSFYGRGGFCESLGLLEVSRAKAIGEHVLGKERSINYIPAPLYKNMLSKISDIVHYESFNLEDHPKSNLGNLYFDMVTLHCHDEELLKKGTEEYHKVCEQADSVVYSRMHLHIIARKK